MSLKRKMQRAHLKEEWRKFKKEHRQYKNMPFAQFNKLWKESMIDSKAQNAVFEMSEEQEMDLADMLLEDVEEDEDQAIE